MSLRILHIPYTCTGCGACVSSCPKHALSLVYDADGFYAPKLNELLCVDCKVCEKVCHVLNNHQPSQPSRNYKAYMVKSYDLDLVKNHASSGGAFTLMAQEILKENGVVYGARYNFEKERLEHASTDHVPLQELQKSKYIESFMGNTFADVRKQLLSGRKVMFVGTPCQVEGLHTFLAQRKTDMQNLLLVRFVCHGVPANKFFTEYKHYEESKFGSEMTFFDFRPKSSGWRSSDWLMRFKNGREEKGPYYYYYYYYYFQLCTLLRSCCYSCKRVMHEIADVTIADFWGIHMYRPENKDQDGISLVIVHNAVGGGILENMKPYCECEELPASAVDYIYREANDRKDYLNKSKSNKAKVREIGYMSFVIKTLRGSMVVMKLKHKLRKIFLWIRK